MKKVCIICVAVLAILLLPSCKNGVYFGPSIDGTNGTNTTITDGTIDGSSGEEEDENSLDDIVHTGEYEYSYSIIQQGSTPENMMYSDPEGLYARLSDTSGNGFTANFDISLVLPETEANKNVTVKIGSYKSSLGDSDLVMASFEGSSKEKVFNTSSSAKVSIQFAEKRLEQRGVLPITFTYDPTVYADTVPRTLYFLISSKGNNVKKVVSIESVTEKVNKSDAYIFEGSEPLSWNIAITDSEEASKHQNYILPLTIKLYNVESGAPLTLSATSSSGIEVTNTAITPPTEEGSAIASFDVIVNDFGVLEPSTGSVTVTLDSSHSQIYAGLPMTITLNTQRREFFNAYVQSHANNFTTKSSGDTQENEKYYTDVIIAPLTGDSIELDKEVNYVIRRIDDTSSEKKQIATGSFISQNGFTYKDSDALILTKNPKYEVELSSSSSKVVSVNMKEGTRNLTNREMALAVINSIRYAVIDKKAYDLGNIDTGHKGKTIENNMVEHYRAYNYEGGPNYHHYYSFRNYKPFFIELFGALDGDKGVAFHYKSHTSLSVTNTDNANSIKSNIESYKGTVNFFSVFGNGSMKFNNIIISDNNWVTPSWTSGTLSVTVNGSSKTYNKDNLRFAFYNSWGDLLSYVAPGGNYTQK